MTSDKRHGMLAGCDTKELRMPFCDLRPVFSRLRRAVKLQPRLSGSEANQARKRALTFGVTFGFGGGGGQIRFERRLVRTLRACGTGIEAAATRARSSSVSLRLRFFTRVCPGLFGLMKPLGYARQRRGGFQFRGARNPGERLLRRALPVSSGFLH